MTTPELEPITLTPNHQARIDESKASAEAAHQDGMGRVLADATATSRRLAASAGFTNDASLIYGDHCVNCNERWALPADKATCAHKPICEDCWPNGCDHCEREVEEGIQRRLAAVNRITSAALELRTGADDLSETDLSLLDWRDRKDVLRHVQLSIDALSRVASSLGRQVRGETS